MNTLPLAIEDLRCAASEAGWIIDRLHMGGRCGSPLFYREAWWSANASYSFNQANQRLKMTASVCEEDKPSIECMYGGGLVAGEWEVTNYIPFKANMSDEEWVAKCTKQLADIVSWATSRYSPMKTCDCGDVRPVARQFCCKCFRIKKEREQNANLQMRT